MAEKTRRAVAGKTEIMEFLTGVMRGETDAPKVSERTKAAELLGRSKHIFTERAEKAKTLQVRIWGEEDLK